MRFKTKPRTNTDRFIFAYHRGQWVEVPLFYVPDEAVGEDGHLHYFQFILLDEKKTSKPSPRRCCNSAYKRIAVHTKATIIPWFLTEIELKELCTRNDIPLGWVIGLFQKNTPSKAKSKNRSSRGKQRKCFPLTEEEYRKFIKELKSINKRDALIAGILWFFNKCLAPGDDYITFEELLRLKVHDVDPADALTQCIRMCRSSSRGTHMLVYYLPTYIWKPLCREIRFDSLYVFSNRNRGPLLPSDIDKHFKDAGKRAGIKKPVSSLSFRPISKHDVNSFNASQDDVKMQELSVEEWKNLCSCIPGLLPKRGCRSKHDQREVFNGILFHLRTHTSLRNLPSDFPPWQAIHSQYMRWLKNGVFKAVLSARQ